jgi:hypothetical protein
MDNYTRGILTVIAAALIMLVSDPSGLSCCTKQYQRQPPLPWWSTQPIAFLRLW